MSLRGDLLDQARKLATMEPKRPKQASLRRAVSAAHCALFHLLTEEAARFFVAGSRRSSLRNLLRRSLGHAEMKDAARGFARQNVSEKIKPALRGESVQPQLAAVADAFIRLQEARHEADYDVGMSFTRQEVLGLIELAEAAFADWREVRASLQADAFLAALPLQRQMRR